MRVALLCLVVAAACQAKNPHFCENPPCTMADASVSCSASKPCPSGHCNVDKQVCVECLDSTHCTAAEPVCSTMTNTCGPCTQHGDCESRVCRPDGQCEMEASVAYVDGVGGSDTAMCTRTAPCRTITTAMTKGKANIKIAETVTDVVLFDATDTFTLYAEKTASLTRSSSGPIVEAKDTANVTIHGLKIQGTSGTTGIALTGGSPKVRLDRVTLVGHGSTSNSNRALTMSTGELTLLRSNVIDNIGGGVQISGGIFVIVGNMFTNNGSDQSPVGGVNILTNQSSMHRLEFNSFHRNKTIDAQGTGVVCAVNQMTARNNILFNNGTLTNDTQFSGACTHVYSLVQPNTPAGGNNIGGDPLFVNGLTGDLHLMPNSPALGKADPNTVMNAETVDLDAHVRANPADVGADEVP